ncbi:MAG: DUF2007 domain-containing protein [Bacteroidetes bacterium]|nr:DUF2007 domain-containing protein [Bacteroidota bacterium]
MQLVTVKTFEDHFQARLLESKLESEGIPSVVLYENIITLNRMYNVAMGGILLKVHSDDYERSRKIIIDIDNSPWTDEDDQILECPKCQSTNLYGGFLSFRSLPAILAVFISFIAGGCYPIYFKSVYRCKKCGTEFKNVGE